MTTAYDELEQAWKREFHSPELQPLRQGFFKELAAYIKRLKEGQRNVDAKSLKATVMDEEIFRLEQLIAQFLDRRLHKLCTQTRLAQPSGLEYTEKQAYQALSGVYRDYERMKQDVLQGREPSISKSRGRELALVRFVRDVPSIIGVDLKAHGPFHKEDVANLPSENAENLIRQGATVEIFPLDRDNG